VIATGASGPLRFSAGTVRDHLLGITVVDAHGRVVSAGGRVVKNVAGYNLCRLYAGSLGTLGVIVEATFQVRPLPAAHACVWTGWADADRAEHALAAVIASPIGPAYIELLCPAGVAMLDVPARPGDTTARWWLATGVQGHPDAVHQACGAVSRDLDALGATGVEVHEADRADADAGAVADWPASVTGQVVWRAGVRSSQVLAFCEHAQHVAHLQDLRVALCAHAGNGIVYGVLPDGVELDTARPVVQALRAWVQRKGGHVVVLRAPDEWKSSLSIWGEPPAGSHLMRRLKQALDPQSILNPGRYIDGL